jgi:hypothetical protein
VKAVPTQKIIVVQLQYSSLLNKSVIDAQYEVEAQVTPRCFVFYWGRDLSIKYKAKRCGRSARLEERYGEKPGFSRGSWFLSRLSDGRRIQAYTPEYWERVKHLYATEADLLKVLLRKD